MYKRSSYPQEISLTLHPKAAGIPDGWRLLPVKPGKAKLIGPAGDVFYCDFDEFDGLRTVEEIRVALRDLVDDLAAVEEE